jgi:hypothetical protein
MEAIEEGDELASPGASPQRGGLLSPASAARPPSQRSPARAATPGRAVQPAVTTPASTQRVRSAPRESGSAPRSAARVAPSSGKRDAVGLANKLEYVKAWLLRRYGGRKVPEFEVNSTTV